MIRLGQHQDAPAVAETVPPGWWSSGRRRSRLIRPMREAIAARIESCLVRFPWLVAEESGTVVGYAYASPHRTRPAYQWSVEVSAYVRDHANDAALGGRSTRRCSAYWRCRDSGTRMPGSRRPTRRAKVPPSARVHSLLLRVLRRRVQARTVARRSGSSARARATRRHGASPHHRSCQCSPARRSSTPRSPVDPTPRFRLAADADVPAVRRLIETSVRGLSEPRLAPAGRQRIALSART